MLLYNENEKQKHCLSVYVDGLRVTNPKLPEVAIQPASKPLAFEIICPLT